MKKENTMFSCSVWYFIITILIEYRVISQNQQLTALARPLNQNHSAVGWRGLQPKFLSKLNWFIEPFGCLLGAAASLSLQ